MRIRVAGIGQRMPGWVQEGWKHYARRMPRELSLELHEIPLRKRGRNADIARLRRQEGEALLAAARPSDHLVAVDRDGRAWSTAQLAERLQDWQQGGRDVTFLVGGPDGLDPGCIETARERWSLGPLTLPHPLVRVMLAEQFYRAWTITSNHPYHRA